LRLPPFAQEMRKGWGNEPQYLEPKAEPAKPAPNAGFRGRKAQNQAKIGVSPIKTQENCGKAAFSH